MFLARTLGRTLAEIGEITSVEFQLWLMEYRMAPWAPFADVSGSDPAKFFGRL
jgi:hypothetical protein